jgi:hypothetical protein
MNEYDDGKGDRYDVVNDTLRSITRAYHLQRYGEDLILAAHDKHFLIDQISSESEHMQIFVLCHLVSWAYDDDPAFVFFCKECLTSESSFDLKSAAILYLTGAFNSTVNYELLWFLRGLLSDLLRGSRALTLPRNEAAGKLSVFIFASIMICLGRDSEMSPDMILDEHVLDELGRAIRMKIEDDESGEERDNEEKEDRLQSKFCPNMYHAPFLDLPEQMVQLMQWSVILGMMQIPPGLPHTKPPGQWEERIVKLIQWGEEVSIPQPPMSKYSNGERDRSSVVGDTLHSIVRAYHLQRYGEDLIIEACDKQSLIKWINSDVEYAQLFVLCHLLSWAYDDDSAFVVFCRGCLTSESSFDLKSAAIMYLTKAFYRTANYELLWFLRGVLANMLRSAKTLTRPKNNADHNLSVFVYASIMMCLDRVSEIPVVLSRDLDLDGHVLDELDRAIRRKKGK